ncbi:MAG: hypothetical protein RLZZ106_1359 [Cyanobacteriota bacterium]|jgi:hypothetical protein
MGTPDLTLQECCERWGVSSRNSVKARAAALGVELRRESSTRTVWPREDIPLGDELHEHIQTGGTLKDFPGALPQPAKPAPIAAPQASALTPAGGASDAIALALLQVLQQQQAPPQAGPLARARAMAEAADERLPLTTPELAELVGLDQEEVGRLKAGTVLYGFRLQRVGPTPRKGQPDRRAWLLGRVDAAEEGDDAVGAVTPVPALTGTSAKRAPGFVACIDAEATVMGRLELPSW